MAFNVNTRVLIADSKLLVATSRALVGNSQQISLTPFKGGGSKCESVKTGLHINTGFSGLFAKTPIRMNKGPPLRQRLFAMVEVMEIWCASGLATNLFMPMKVMIPTVIGSKKVANQRPLGHHSSLKAVSKDPLSFEVKIHSNAIGLPI